MKQWYKVEFYVKMDDEVLPKDIHDDFRLIEPMVQAEAVADYKITDGGDKVFLHYPDTFETSEGLGNPFNIMKKPKE